MEQSSPRSAPLPSPLAVALGFREHGEFFPSARAGPDAGLDIGLATSISFGRLRALFAQLRVEAPDLNLRFVEGYGSELALEVSEGRLDLAFVEDAVSVDRCATEALWAEPLLIALPERHPLHGTKLLERAALREEAFLLAAGPAAWSSGVERIHRALHGPPRSVVPAPVHHETLMNLVGLDYGLAVVLASAAGAFYPGVAYRALEGPQPLWPLYCVRRIDNREPDVEAVLDLARAAAIEGRAR
jgi:DNA-binding transcriptional LysR family regulator